MIKSILEYIFLILAIAIFSLILLKEYRALNIYTCNIYHDVSMAERQCEYVDGIVKIKL